MENSRKAVIIGISGASSSGKTTMCQLLRDIFPNTFILHQDNFFKHEEEVPDINGQKDWDCADAISLSDLIESLEYIRQNGKCGSRILENKSPVSVCSISESAIAPLKAKVADWLAPGQPGHLLLSKNMCLLEGFLIYSHSTSVLWSYLDLKIFLQASQLSVKTRREARMHQTGENFWQDPPDYVNNIVWPNYCRDHKWLFENEDVEGRLLEKSVDLGEVRWQGGTDIDIESTLIWAVELLMKELPGLLNAIK